MVQFKANKAVIITALPIEFEAVCHYLKDTKEIQHPKGTIYSKGYFHYGRNIWEILVAEVGKGDPAAAQETERALAFHNPDVALFVGISGGIKDIKMGDVVAADKVYYYESGKWSSRSEKAAEFLPRPMVFPSGYRLVQKAKALARKNEWQKLLNTEDYNPNLSAIVGPIAAGESVVASKSSDVYKLIQKTYGDSIALAMEDFGFMRAVYANPDVDAIVIRGISDLIDNKLVADSMNWQLKAARHACAFAFKLLSELDLNYKDLQNKEIKSSIINDVLRETDQAKEKGSKSYGYLDQYDNPSDFLFWAKKLKDNLEILKTDLKLVIECGFEIIIAIDFFDLFEYCFPFANDLGSKEMFKSKFGDREFLNREMARHLLFYKLDNLYSFPVLLLPPYIQERNSFFKFIGKLIIEYKDDKKREFILSTCLAPT